MAAVTIEGGPGEEDSSSRPMVDANGPVEKEEEAGEEKEEAPQQQQQQASPPPPPPPDCEEEEPPGDDDTTTEHKGEMDVSGGGEGNGGHGATQEEEEEEGEKKPSPPAVKDMVPLKPDIKKEEDGGGGEQQPPGAVTSPGPGPGPPGPGRGGWPSGGTEPPVEEEGGDGGCSQEQRAVEESGSSSPPPPGGDCCTKSTEKPQHGAGGGGVAGGGGGGGGGGGTKRRASVEISSSDGEPLSRMDSEDSISSTLMDMESTASSGRSTPAMMTPAMMNGGGSGGLVSGPGSTTGSVTGGSKALVGYTCCWDNCLLLFPSSPDLAEHIRSMHVDGQRGGVFVCLWKGCKVYNTPSTSQSWLQRHMLSHSGDKPFKCVVGGCNATFASQGGLARHVPTHFSSQSSSKMASQGKVKEESPSKAGLNKRRKLKNKRRRSLPRPHDFFDAQTMDAIRHRAICLNLATQIEGLGNGHSVVFHSTVIARRKEDSGKVKVLLHWTPEDIMPDVWVNESDRPQQKTKVVHLSKLPTDTAVLLDPNIYRMFF